MSAPITDTYQPVVSTTGYELWLDENDNVRWIRVSEPLAHWRRCYVQTLTVADDAPTVEDLNAAVAAVEADQGAVVASLGPVVGHRVPCVLDDHGACDIDEDTRTWRVA